MASSDRMLTMGVVWITGVFVLFIMAYLGGLFYGYVLNFFSTIRIAPVLQSGAAGMWWFMPLYYAVILISGIVLTYRCYQEVVIKTDYFPEEGY